MDALTAEGGRTHSVARREEILHVLFGRDGYAVFGCGTKMPVLQSGQHFVIDNRPQAGENRMANDVPLLVDHNFNDFISGLNSLKVVPIDVRFGSGNTYCRADFEAGHAPIRQRTVRGSRGWTGLGVVCSNLGSLIGQLCVFELLLMEALLLLFLSPSETRLGGQHLGLLRRLRPIPVKAGNRGPILAS